MPTPTVTIELNLNESGTLCHLMTKAAMEDSGYMPIWWCKLHQKLMDGNDKLRYKQAPKRARTKIT